MHHTTLGSTSLRVSVAGLGTGGFSRLGLKSGKSEAEASRLIHEAVGLGINFIDTGPSYATEGAVGKQAYPHFATLMRATIVARPSPSEPASDRARRSRARR